MAVIALWLGTVATTVLFARDDGRCRARGRGLSQYVRVPAQAGMRGRHLPVRRN